VWGHVGEHHSCSSAFYFNPETHVGAISFANGNYPDFSLVYAVNDLDLHLIKTGANPVKDW